MTVLEGTAVRLRPLRPAEYPTVMAWYQDPEAVAPHDRYLVDTLEGLARAVESAEGDPGSVAPRFAIERRTDGTLVGLLGYYRAHPVLEYLDLWYLIGDRTARGQGLGREAVERLVDHLFRTTSVERIGAAIDAQNEASCRLVDRLGFRLEGTLRSALFHHGRWHDVRVYGVTRPEWDGRAPRA